MTIEILLENFIERIHSVLQILIGICPKRERNDGNGHSQNE